MKILYNLVVLLGCGGLSYALWLCTEWLFDTSDIGDDNGKDHDTTY